MLGVMRNRSNGCTEMFRIGEIAREAGVQADTLRYYERLGLVEPAARSAAGYRLYKLEALDRIAFIRKAQALGLTLEEIGDMIQSALAGSSPCRHVRDALARRLQDVDRRIYDLQQLRQTIVAALERPAMPADEACLCPIIESQEPPPDSGPTAGREPRRTT